MNKEDFVARIKEVAYHAAARGTVAVLQKPPGRSPDPQLVALSGWFNKLGSSDRETVTRVADLAANQAVYNIFLVLDGLLAIEAAGPKGKLELVFENESVRIV